MKATVKKVIAISTIISPVTRLDAVKEDPDDNRILECAVDGMVDYLVSQDNHLLKFSKYGKIRIVSPEEFLRLF